MVDILAYIEEHHDHFFYVVAGLSFILELTLLGLGGPLLFFAIASFITAFLISVGLISGWEVEVFVLGVTTALIALALWKPLKKFQNAGGGSDSSSDMIGRQVAVANDITSTAGSIRYSGINWNARLARHVSVPSIEAGKFCVICAVDGNVMLVEPLAS
jgi:inner membrane protein